MRGLLAHGEVGGNFGGAHGTLGGLLDDAQPHELGFGAVGGVEVGGVQGPVGGGRPDHSPAADVLGDDRPFDRDVG